MDFSFLSKWYEMILKGTGITISVSLIALFFGFIIGLFICLAKLSKNKFLSRLASVYIEVLRGTPLLAQIFLLWFGLPQIRISIPGIFGISSEFVTAAVALSINSGAYVAEIFRSGIQSVDNGQMEASRSLGLNYSSTMRYVIVPQAIRNILPALANEFISLIKESSIISVIGVKEIMFVQGVVKNSTFKPLEPLIVAALIYFVLTFTLSKLVGILEKKFAMADA